MKGEPEKKNKKSHRDRIVKEARKKGKNRIVGGLRGWGKGRFVKMHNKTRQCPKKTSTAWAGGPTSREEPGKREEVQGNPPPSDQRQRPEGFFNTLKHRQHLLTGMGSEKL